VTGNDAVREAYIAATKQKNTELTNRLLGLNPDGTPKTDETED
jgi:hypothetical protein